MKTLAETIVPAFARCLQDGIHDAPKGSQFVAVHVSSCHMSIFWEAYSSIRDVEKDMAAILLDGQAYSQIKLVWHIQEEALVYYDAMGFLSSARDYYEEHKNDAKPEPLYTPPLETQPHPNVKADHFCQADPGAPEICYFCGGRVAPVERKEVAVVIPKPPDEEEDEEDLGLENCPQCDEEAWDGYICHSCGAKNI